MGQSEVKIPLLLRSGTTAAISKTARAETGLLMEGEAISRPVLFLR
jgi:hypothetical protein